MWWRDDHRIAPTTHSTPQCHLPCPQHHQTLTVPRWSPLPTTTPSPSHHHHSPPNPTALLPLCPPQKPLLLRCSLSHLCLGTGTAASLHSLQPPSIFGDFVLGGRFSSATPMLGFCKPHSHQSSQSPASPLPVPLPVPCPSSCPSPLAAASQIPAEVPAWPLIAEFLPHPSSSPIQTPSFSFPPSLPLPPPLPILLLASPTWLGQPPHCVSAGCTPKPGSGGWVGCSGTFPLAGPPFPTDCGSPARSRRSDSPRGQGGCWSFPCWSSPPPRSPRAKPTRGEASGQGHPNPSEPHCPQGHHPSATPGSGEGSSSPPWWQQPHASVTPCSKMPAGARKRHLKLKAAVA